VYVVNALRRPVRETGATFATGLAEQRDPGDLSTLDDPNALEEGEGRAGAQRARGKLAAALPMEQGERKACFRQGRVCRYRVK